MRNVRQHPRFPFIKVGIFVDQLAVSLGIDYPPTDNDPWCYTIDGDDGYPIVRDEDNAIRSAEESLFNCRPDVVQKYTQIAIGQQDFKLAMALAARQGYWEAVADEREKVANIARNAQALLQSLTL
ncbi:hypothetical protein D3C77_403590 [compost metagenome]